MELYGQNTGRNGSQPDQPEEWAAAGAETGLEESMRQLGLLTREFYPERAGVRDCDYYMRTGSCAYGSKCRYNHPRDRSSVGGNVRSAELEYPERVGELECPFYLRTGTCKFGVSCKFHHPRNGGGSLSDVPLNINGYPLRPGEKECSYYLKTGHCKYRITCKFHHPQQLVDISMPASLQPLYSSMPSPAPSPEQYGGTSASYRAARPPVLQGSYVSSAYGPLLLPPGVVPIPNWNPYSVPGSPAMSPGANPSIGATSYGMPQLSPRAPAFVGPFSSVPVSADPVSNIQIERVFPERHGQPSCQYYMKNGDCKFGLSCKYHHPPDWAVSKTNCLLSHLGLPLRPGVQSCSFYLQNGYCKFGKTCKYDHPVGDSNNNTPSSSLTDMTVSPPYMLQSSPATLTPIPFSELRPEFISGPELDSHITGVSSSIENPSSNTGASFFP